MNSHNAKQDPKNTTENQVKQGLMARQARIAIAGLLGVGVVGLTAGLLLQKPVEVAKGSDTQLLPVSAKAAPTTAKPTTPVTTTASSPTVRTQQPLKVPELPFLVSKAGTPASSGTTTGKTTETLSATGVSSSTGLKNPFRPFRLDPKVTSVTSSGPTPGTPYGPGGVSTPPVVVKSPGIIDKPVIEVAPPKGSTNSPTPTPVVPKKPTPLPAPSKILVPTPAVVALPLVTPRVVDKMPITPEVIRVIKPAPKPTLKAPATLQPSNLPENLSQGTLSVIPPVLRDTISPQNAMTQGEEAPVMVPETLPDISVSSLPTTAGAPLEVVSDTVQDGPNLIAPGDKVMPDAPVIKLPSALETLVKDRDLTFSTAVLGPINTAIFRGKNGFAVVQLGQTLPGSSAVVQSITAEKVILQLGEDKLELNLDRR
jgi:hypothetical protein